MTNQEKKIASYKLYMTIVRYKEGQATLEELTKTAQEVLEDYGAKAEMVTINFVINNLLTYMGAITSEKAAEDAYEDAKFTKRIKGVVQERVFVQKIKSIGTLRTYLDEKYWAKVNAAQYKWNAGKDPAKVNTGKRGPTKAEIIAVLTDEQKKQVGLTK